MSRNSYNSGSIPSGSRSVTMYRGANDDDYTGTALGTYSLETETPTRPSTIVQRRGITNQATGWRADKDFDSVSGVAQLENSSAEVLQRYDWFIVTFDDAEGAEKWVLTEVSQPESQADARKQSFTAQKDYAYTA